MDGYRARARPFSEIQSERTRSNSQKLQKAKFWLAIKNKIMDMREVKHRNTLLGEVV